MQPLQQSPTGGLGRDDSPDQRYRYAQRRRMWLLVPVHIVVAVVMAGFTVVMLLKQHYSVAVIMGVIALGFVALAVAGYNVRRIPPAA
jgi:hypothetical protein